MIGNKIRYFRKKAGFTQAELASLMKISAAAIGLYEQNRREPDLGTIANLSQCLNVSVEDLLGLDTNNLSEPDKVVLGATNFFKNKPKEEDPLKKRKEALYSLLDEMNEEQLLQINDYIEFIANKKK